MGGVRVFYKYVLSSVLLVFGVIFAYACVQAVWDLYATVTTVWDHPRYPNGLGLVWAALMLISSFLAFTNSYRSYSGHGRLQVEEWVEYGIQRLADILVASSKIPIIGPTVFAALFIVASTAVFSFAYTALSDTFPGSIGSMVPASLSAPFVNLIIYPMLDSSGKISSIMLSLGRIVVVFLLVNAIFALPAQRRFSWSSTRTVLSTYGVVLMIGCAWLAIGIRELSLPLIGGSIPYLLGPGLSFWYLRRQ